MSTLTEKNRVGEFILAEANGTISREVVVVASGAGILESGTALGKVTATGKYNVYDNNLTDGTQLLAGILYNSVNATSADQDAVMICRDAEVASEKIVWASANSAGDKTAGIADLAALSVFVRS